MTIINPKSISGITSITTASGADNLFTVHTNNTTERFRIDSTGTASFGGDVSIGGTVSVGGTITYEDVTNVDSVGLITARNGIEIGARPGVGASISVDGNAIFSGITTTASLKVTGSGGINISYSGADLTMNSGGSIFTGNGGNASDPIVANVSDTNTGFFYPAADTLAVTTGGTERLRIDSTGDIGLGESSPNRTGYGSPVVSIGYNTSNNYSVLELLGNKTSDANMSTIVGYNVGGSSRIAQMNFVRDGANNSGAITFDTYASGSSAERVRITSAGNVGIGDRTTSPDELLHVHTGSGEAKIHVEAATNARVRIRAHSGESIVQFADAASSNPGEINYTHSSDSMSFRTNGSVRATINSDGFLTKASGLTCAFNASGSNMSRTDASGYVCEFDNDSSSGHIDSGNNFNTSTHKFVAPVSGYYYFFTNIRLDSFNTGYIRTAILSTSYNTNSTYYTIPATGHVITYADNGSIQTVQTSTVMYLPATHEAWVYQDPSADTSYTVYLDESSFGGYFIG